MSKPVASNFRAISAFGLLATAVIFPGCDLLTVSQTGRHIREGNEAVERGEFARAVQHYESALDGTMLSSEAHYRLGLLYEDKLKNQVGALHHFERYLELAPQGQFATDVKGYADKLRLVIVSSLAEGTVIPAREATRLKNENLELQKQVAELRKAAANGRSGAAAVRATAPPLPSQTPAMVVAATPPPAPPAATPEPEVRRAVAVNAASAAPAPDADTAGATDAVGSSGVRPVGAPAATAAAVPAVAAAGRSHTVVSGDTLAGIARKYYGKSGAWQKIAEANKDVLADPTKLKPGMVLKIP